jgi:hypothetical protein
LREGEVMMIEWTRDGKEVPEEEDKLSFPSQFNG